MKMKSFNYEEMFAQSIGLQEPWRVERVEYDEEEERIWRHGDVCFFPCYVHCRRPRIKCGNKYHVVTAPWARKGSRYTLLFESYAMLLMRSMPVEHARKLLCVSHTAMRRILKYWVGKAVSNKRNAGKKLLMIPEERQNEQQREAVALLSKKYPKTGRAFRMVQGLDEMYRCNHPSEAEKIFNRLTSWLKRSRLEPMKKVADTLRKHKKSILGYFFARVTNAVAEGINSIIQSAKRRARGYRTLESYKCMIYLVAGKFSLDCPPLFT